MEAMKKSQDAELQLDIFNVLPNPVLIHTDGKVVFANEMILRLTGNTMSEVVGKDVVALLADPADLRGIEALKKITGDELESEEEFEIRTDKRNIVIRNFLLRNNRIRYNGIEAVMTILIDITERKHLEKYVISRVIETEEKDRKQFAVDLHDDLGPTLSSIKLHLGLLEIAKTPEKFAETLKICTNQIDEAIAKMRRIANNLMPRLIVNFGLDAALSSFLGSMRHEGVFEIEFRSNLNGARFPKQVELHFYRIISELVNNTLKHSGASGAIVSLKKQRNRLTLVYSDNGKGYDVEEIKKRPGGLGIGNLIQRAVLIDAQITFSRKRKKTVVTIVKDL
jgi:PAS domain S-box-containing protein